LARRLQTAAGVGELGTFRLASGELVRCLVGPSGRLALYRESGPRLVPADPRLLLDAVKLSDDPTWLIDTQPAFAGTLPAD
jgi:hypothetical protein